MGKKPKSKSKSKPKQKIIVGAEEENHSWPCDGPCLLILRTCTKTKKTLTFYDISRRRHQSQVPPHITSYAYIRGAHGHWLLMKDAQDEQHCHILNTVTMETLLLPPLDKDLDYDCRFLVHDQTVFIMIPGEDDVILSCQLGADEFRQHNLIKKEGDYCVSDVIIFQDKLYYVTSDSYTLFCSELSDDNDLEFREVIPGERLRELIVFGDYEFTYLIQSGDRILFVDARAVGMGAVNFRIFRADLAGKGWEKVYNVGDDRAIFVDRFGGFSAHIPAGCVGVKGNCIYHNERDDNDAYENPTLHAYNLEEQSDTVLPAYPFKIDHLDRPQMLWIRTSNN